jgi:hypothetical protein
MPFMPRAARAHWVVLALIVAASAIGMFMWRAAPATAPHAESAWFIESANPAGLHFDHDSGHAQRYAFPEVAVGGVCLIDYDHDSHLDVYFVQAGPWPQPHTSGNVLYRNLGDGTFENSTHAAGVGDTAYGMGCTVADYDGDGFDDLYVTNVGANVLYRNLGDGTFKDVTAQAAVADPSWGASAVFFDSDHDGDLDLFVTNYVGWSMSTDIPCFAANGASEYCSPRNYNAPAPDRFYRNSGDGTFVESSREAGFAATFGTGLGVACGDFNDDGHLDLYVANDAMPNQLWINDGQGAFTDEALLAGCSVNLHGTEEAGMGVSSIDIDSDGDLDLFMTHLMQESNTLYVNQDGWFSDSTGQSGLAAPSLDFTGFGLGFADFNLDGFVDLFVANGRVKRVVGNVYEDNPYHEPNQLFAGTSQGFREVHPRGGTDPILYATSRGAAFGDMDNDGDVDIIVLNRDGGAHYLRNAHDDEAWIGFDVRTEQDRNAIAARVAVLRGERWQYRQVQTAYSYLSSNDPRVHFGLGTPGTVDDVRVRWPDGTTSSFGSFESGQFHQLKRGDGRPVNE